MTTAGDLEALPVEVPFAGIARRAFTTARATVQEYRFEPGASYPLHSHLQEQITLVLDGDLTFSSGGETSALAAGQWSVVGAHVEHGITAGSSGTRFLAVLVPPRGEGEAPLLVDTPKQVETR